MADERMREDPWKQYFESVKTWAEAALTGDFEGGIPLMPMPFRDPFCREVFARLRAVEGAVERSGQCPLAGTEAGSKVIELLVGGPQSKGAVSKTDGLREIRDFTSGAERLVIVDPYAYGGEGLTEAATYVDELARTARISGSSLKELHIIYNSRHGRTKSIMEGVAKRAADAGVKLTDCDTDTFHDRVWIADRSRGLVVGTSFGGLGKRAAFLLELPELDLRHVLEFIDSNGLMARHARHPKETPVRKRRAKQRSR